MNDYRPAVWFILIASFLLSSCSSPVPPHKTTAQFVVFGTLVNVLVLTESDAEKTKAKKAIHAIEVRFNQLHNTWHAWKKGGLIADINSAITQQTPIDVPENVKHFIQTSQQLSLESDGLFDPGIGKLIRLWGFHGEHWQGPPPLPAQRQAWLKNPASIQHITFKGNTLMSSNPQVSLDFGGNAKGMALDIAVNTLRLNGIQNAIVNIGGDMRVMGQNGQNAWKIGVQNPKNPYRPVATIPLTSGESIVTSGSYQRFFEWQGEHYSHIINPNTAQPVLASKTFLSVTVIHRDATRADAAATALMVAGLEHWEKIAQHMQITDLLAITQAGKIITTKSMQSRIQPSK